MWLLPRPPGLSLQVRVDGICSKLFLVWGDHLCPAAALQAFRAGHRGWGPSSVHGSAGLPAWP